MTDVLVAGAGPAAWAAAAACARVGLDTVVVAPDPRARWPATYGMWADECAALPTGSRWLEANTRVIATSEHHLSRRYAVLDNDSVRAALAPGVRTVTGGAVEVHSGPCGSSVTLSSGRVLAAAVVIDATGTRRALSGGRLRGARVEQSAFGVAVPAEQAAALVAPGEALFMDWRAAPGFDASTFLYAVPVPGGRVLLEETSLARRPGLGLAELRARLLARLGAHGVRAAGPTERVRFPLDLPATAGRAGVVAFGAAAGLVHPATGYSVAESFRLAPQLAAAIADGLGREPGAAASAARQATWMERVTETVAGRFGREPDAARQATWMGLAGHGPRAAVRAGRRAVWPAAARAVYLLRRRGLAVLLGLPPARLPEFFELFFRMPPDLQQRYLAGHADLSGTTAAMVGIFRAADRSLQTNIARHWAKPVNLAAFSVNSW